jgi:uncharacterized membrane protein (UPF0127 family)
VIALVVIAALAFPVVIGTAVVIKRALFDDDERVASNLPVVAGFGRVGFRVDDNPTVRCALLASNEAAQEQGMQGMADLRGYDAMVFAFEEEKSVAFINHFVPIDLSIGWYDEDGVLVDHTTMNACPTGKDCPIYASKDPFRYAIETPVGGLEAMGLAATGAIVHVGGACT